MTLRLLFNVPMSLSDIHFLCPFDFEAFAQRKNYRITTRSTDQDWGAGERTLIDLDKRLQNALQDARMDSTQVSALLQWLQKAMPYFQQDEYSGANVGYMIEKPRKA